MKFTRRVDIRQFATNKSIIAHYSPPGNIPPGEMGILFDLKMGRLEYLAILYDLKARKIIDISRRADNKPVLKLLKYEVSELSNYEDVVLKYFFRNTREVLFDSSSFDADAVYLQRYTNFLLLQSLQKLGYLHLSDNFLTMKFEEFEANRLNLMLAFWTHPEKFLTDKAKKLAGEIVGFREFIRTARISEIKFHATGDPDSYVDELTPYAITLNLLDRWRVVKPPFMTQPHVVPDYPPLVQSNKIFETPEERTLRERQQHEYFIKTIRERLDSYIVTVQTL